MPNAKKIQNAKIKIQKEYPSPTLILPLPLGGGGNRRGWAF